MAKIDAEYAPTEHLIKESDRRYYKAYMHAGHWQLRSFVNAPKQDNVHYLGGKDIYRINTSTQKREILDTVPFEPRCLVSANGFVCCGGATGEFTALRLYDSAERSEISRLRNAYKLSRTGTIPLLKASKDLKFGKEIVNCITLWFPNEETKDSSFRPLAIVASNDHRIYIVELETLTVLQNLEHEEPVNLGVISPDGTLLTVVGDDPYMRVYKRQLKTEWPVKATRHSDNQIADWHWVLFSETLLPGQEKNDINEMRGSFTGSFNHKLFAVGTQYGTVAVFDQDDLRTWRDPIPKAVFQTSRPKSKPGAIRSLQFNPSYFFELLAVTEDDGRVNVIDVREMFQRQILYTKLKSTYKEVSLEMQDEHIIDSSLGDEADSTDDEPDQHHSVLERQRRTERSQYDIDQALQRDLDLFLEAQRLTADETDVLRALQAQRARRQRQLIDDDVEVNDALDPNDPERLARSYDTVPAFMTHSEYLRQAEELIEQRRRREELERDVRDIQEQLRARQQPPPFRINGITRALREERNESRRSRDSLDAALGAHVERRQHLTRLQHEHQLERIREVERAARLEAQREASAIAADETISNLHAADQSIRSRTPTTGDLLLRETFSLQAYLSMVNHLPDRESLYPREPHRRERVLRHPLVRARAIASMSQALTPNEPTTSNERDETVPTSLGIYLNNSGWAEMQALAGLANELPADNDPTVTTAGRLARRNLASRVYASREEALLAQTRMQQSLGWSPYLENGARIHRSRAMGVLAGNGMTDEHATTGCAWSPDGKTLYVGTEGGIYEFHVNVRNRKIAPDVQMA